MHKPLAICSFVVAIVGCGDVVRAPITVVVDTDRARALEEQDRLQELRVGVQGDRAELEAARNDLQEARRRLEDTASDPGRRAAAAAEVIALEARLNSGSAAGISRAELDAALAASEQRLAAALTVIVTGHATVTPTPTIAASTAPTVGEDARALVAGIRRRLAVRQLVVADVVGGPAHVDRVEAALGKNDVAGAVEAAHALAEAAAAVVVDRPLVRRKYERVSRAAAAAGKGPDAKNALAIATAAIATESFGKANAVLAELEARVR